MKRDYVLRSVQESVADAQELVSAAECGQAAPSVAGCRNARVGRVYELTSLVFSGLLAMAILLTAFSVIWEYSTRKYLRGFSDAIVPVSAAPEEKIQAILDWMARGPTRKPAGIDGSAPDRDPTETLNYRALLQVCGTATNAFINLADSVGLTTRRLLLLDSQRLAKHVSAEVLVDGRWIVVDPAFRVILRDSQGKPLTRELLMDPRVFSVATANIPGYNPMYSYESTTHIRLGRLPLIGLPLRRLLDAVRPGWEESPILSLIAERKSLAMMLAAISLVIFMLLARASLRWYGEHRLGIHSLRVRERIWLALNAFVDRAG
jgi:hypothetical protein